MADHYDEKTRNRESEIADNDPLAELARIIGYDRPAEAKSATADISDPDDSDVSIDLEAELLRELGGDNSDSDHQDSDQSDPRAEAKAVPENAESQEPVVSDDWLTERPADDGYPESEVTGSFESSSDPHLPDVPENLAEAGFLNHQEQADEPNLPDLPDEALFEALEQELSISADELLVEEVRTDDVDVAADWDKTQADWDDAAWDEIVGETTGEEAIATKVNEYPGENESTATTTQHPAFEPPRDDDILADMARFDMPARDDASATDTFDEPASAGMTQWPEADDSDLIDEPDISPFEFDGPEEISVEATVEQPWEEVDSLSDDRTFEEDQSAGHSQSTVEAQAPDESRSIEDMLSERLGEVDGDEGTEIEVSSVSSEIQDHSVDPLDELEADFDDAAASFLVEDEFELDLDEDAEPEVSNLAGEAAVEPVGQDQIASAFTDFLPESAPEATPSNETSEVADENLIWPEYPPDQDDNNSKGLFGASAAIAAGIELVGSSQPGKDQDGSDLDRDIDPTSEPAFDETEWLDALGIDENDSQDRESASSGDVSDAGQSGGSHGDVLPFPAAQAGFLDTRGYGSVSGGVEVQTHDMGSDIFDENAINDTGNAPGFVGEFDVPDLPLDEPRSEAGIKAYFDDDLDGEFASLVDADSGGAAGASADLFRGGSIGRQQDARVNASDANEEYADLENDLGLTGGNVIGGPYRPRPVPVDADAALREPVARTGDGGHNKQGPVIAAVVLGLAVVFGGIAFGWSWLSGGSASSDGPKIIMADKEPVKVLPENPGGTNVPNQDKAVYDKVDGNQNGSVDQRNLNDSAEEPVDVVQKTIDPELLPLEGREGEASDKGEARLTAEDTDSGVTDPGQANPVISPRKVRTMVVRPDGTIVPREEPEMAVASEPEVQPETAAPIAAAPVAEPAAATEPAEVAETQTSEQASSTAVATAAANGAADTDEQSAETETTTGNETLAPVRVVKTVTISKAPVPQTRPSEQPVNVVGQVSETGRVSGTQGEQETAASPQVAAAQPEAAAAAPANAGGYYVQIASQPTIEAANASYANLSSRFSSVIGGRGVDIQRADIPGKGVYHRVRIPAGSKSDAGNLCARYKSAGGNCFVTR